MLYSPVVSVIGMHTLHIKRKRGENGRWMYEGHWSVDLIVQKFCEIITFVIVLLRNKGKIVYGCKCTVSQLTD